jgi:hypothetical protein
MKESFSKTGLRHLTFVACSGYSESTGMCVSKVVTSDAENYVARTELILLPVYTS